MRSGTIGVRCIPRVPDRVEVRVPSGWENHLWRWFGALEPVVLKQEKDLPQMSYSKYDCMHSSTYLWPFSEAHLGPI